MRRLLILAFVLPLLSGCDFFRSIAGRPTSAQIAEKRAALEREEACRQARLDSVKNFEAALRDSLASVDAIRKSNGTIISAGGLDGVAAAALAHRYYVMVGTFSQSGNARRIADEAVARGYEATLINYRNGFIAVGLSGSDSIPEAYAALQVVRDEDFCPSDVWILANE